MIMLVISRPRAKAIPQRAKKGQRGLGLIEVMVAIIVLSVGLLGIVLTQLNSIRGQRSSHARAIAVQLASDMAERMRLNTGAIATNAYADPDSTTYVSLHSGAGTTGPTTPALPSSFSPASQAAYDLNAWRYEVARRLGSTTATGVVREINGQPLSRNVLVMWLERQPTTALAQAALSTRAATCPTDGSPEALVCDPGCPADATVDGAPVNLRCIQIGVQP